MKRLVCIFLVLLMSLGFAVNLSYAEVIGNNAEKTLRDVILVIDISGSMDGTPLIETKKASINFCEKLLNDDKSDSQLAIVAYNEEIRTSGFLTDYIEINNYINSLIAVGGTDLEGGLSKAGELLEEYGREGSTKSIVIMTDGIPNIGVFDENPDRYYPDDGYASAVYNTAWGRLEDYDRYTLGFFHNLYDDEKEFAVQLLKDIQNKGYYEVINADDLDFHFGNIVDDIIDEEANCPIIIIPGMMGSNLYKKNIFGGFTHVWVDIPRIVGQFLNLWGKLSIDLNINNELHVKNNDVEQTSIEEKEREYGAYNAYEDLVNYLCEEFKGKKEVYFFSYDFRQSNIDSAEKLNQMIDDVVLKNSPYKKVDIVAHSMGGLVTSSYVSQFGEEKIRKVITLGTPYEGAPKLINATLQWEVLSNNSSAGVLDIILGFAGLIKAVKASFPGVAELAPTESYFSQYNTWGRYSHTEYDWLKLRRIRHYDILNYDEYAEICRTIFEDNFNKAQEFHNSILESGMNVLANMDNSYFALGINQPTIKTVYFNNGDRLNNLECNGVEYENCGDGTVPYYSASMILKLEHIDNAYKRVLKIETSHNGLVEDTNALVWIKDIILEGSSNISSDEIKSRNYIVINIACPVDVQINHNNEILSSDFKNISTVSDFGRLDFFGTEDDIKSMYLEEWNNYNIYLNGTANGTMEYSICWYSSDGTLIDERAFTDIPISENTIITTNTDKDNNTYLNVDTNDDGIIDRIWQAEENSLGTENIEIPKTGDATHYIHLVILSVLTIIMLVIYIKRERRIINETHNS